LALHIGVEDGYFPGARYCDVAVRLRSELPWRLVPTLGLDYGDGFKRFAGQPIDAAEEFGSAHSTMTIPQKLGDAGTPQRARVIFKLPSDSGFRVDLAYVICGFRGE
jgi:hypothetical protein